MGETLPHLKEIKHFWYQNVTRGIFFSVTLSNVGIKLETVSCNLDVLSEVPTGLPEVGVVASPRWWDNGSDRHIHSRAASPSLRTEGQDGLDMTRQRGCVI